MSFALVASRTRCPYLISSMATLPSSLSWAANCWKLITRNTIKPMWTTSMLPSINSKVILSLKQTLRLTSTTIKWQPSARPSNSTWEDMSTTPSIGKTWPPSAREVESTLQKAHLSPSKLSNNLVPMITSSRSSPRRQSPFKVQDGDG